MSTSSGSIQRQQILNVPQDILVSGNSVWHAGNLAKSEFTPSSHIGTGGTSHAAVTTTTNGFMISTDKSKLDGISTGANKVTSSTTNGNMKIDGTETNVYTHPSGDGNLHIPATGTSSSTKVLKAGSTAGSASWAFVDLSEATGTLSDTQHGSRGGGSLHAVATTSTNGFLSSTDKSKLDGIQSSSINQITADGRYLQLTGGTLTADLTIANTSNARLIINADTDNDSAEDGEPIIVLTQDGSINGTEIKMAQSGVQDGTLMLAPYTDYNTATPTKNYTVFIHDKKIWHEGTFSKTEFTPASHIGTGGTSHALATTTVAGFMDFNDKVKLNGIATGATAVATSTTNGNIKINGAESIVYTHPTTSGNIHLPAGGASGQYVKWSAAGTGAWTTIAWSDISSAPTSTVVNIDDAVTKRHSQNTDTGTTSATFIIGSATDASTTAAGLQYGNNTTINPYLRWSSTLFQFYKDYNNGTGDVWADVWANTFKNSAGTEVSYVGHTHAYSSLTSIPSTFNPPIASVSTLGGVKQGPNISIDSNGLISGNYQVASESADGLLAAADKTKLDNIQISAINQTSADARYLQLSGGTLTGNLTLNGMTLNLGEGLVFTQDANYFGTNADARIIRLNDTNDTAGNVDGGLIFQAYTATDSISIELLRIRVGEFKWKGNDIWNAGNFTPSSKLDATHAGTGGTAHAAVTSSSNGFMISTDKSKIDGISTGANKTTSSATNGNIQIDGIETIVYTHPATNGNIHLPADGVSGQYVKWSAAGTGVWTTPNFTDLSGTATDTQHGSRGGGTLHAVVTASVNGFMISTDKSKLDGISTGANKITTSATNGHVLIDGTDATVYTHPTTNGNIHLPADGVAGQYVKWSSAGTGAWTTVNFTDISGTVTDTQHGSRGGGTLHTAVTTTTNGFMMSTDKSKLDGIASSATLTASSATNGNIKINGTETVVYTHPSGDGNLHVPATSTTNGGKFLKAGATAGSITWTGVAFTDVSGSITATQHAAQTDGTLHAVVSGTVNGFMSSSDKTKLDGIQSSAINQTSADARYLQLTGGDLGGSTLSFGVNGIRPGGTSNTALVLHAGGGNVFLRPDSDSSSTYEFVVSTGGITWGGYTVWHSNNFNPSNKSDVGHTHTVSNITDLTTNYYSKTDINTQMAAKGDAFLSKAQSFTDTNTFTKVGVAVKIQPASAVGASAVLLQINNSTGNSLVTMGTDTSGEATAKVVINGDLQVTGTTTQSATQNIQGDMNVTGNLNVSGNAVLGDSTTDQTTIKGDLRLEGNLMPISRYLEVGRFPVFGIADDFQFETDSISFTDIISHYSTFDTNGNGVFDAPNTGATRYYRLMVSYASSGTDDSTLHIVQEGTATEVISFALPSVNAVLDPNSGIGNKARTWKSAPFTSSYTGNTTFQAQKNVSGNLGIRYIEVIAYDYYA